MSESLDAHMIARYLEGDLTISQAHAFEKLLENSREARDLFEREKALFAILGDAPAALEQLDIVGGVRARLGRSPPKTRTVFAALAAVILSSIGLGAIISQPDAMQGVVARSAGTKSASRWMGVRTWIMAPGGPKLAGGIVRSDAELLFSYANMGAAPASHLMVFAKDSTGSIRWYHPAWLDPAEDPRAVAIESGVSQQLLPEAIRHELPSGPVVIHALFLSRALSVREVERGLNLSDSHLQAVHHQTIRIEVR